MKNSKKTVVVAMSGGVDSSAIVALMRENTKNEIKTSDQKILDD